MSSLISDFLIQFFIKNGQTWKNKKNLIFYKFTPSNLITYKFEQNVYAYHLKANLFSF